jgi:hypothetical protein
MDEKNLNDHLIRYIAEQYVKHAQEQNELKHICLEMHARYVDRITTYHAELMIREHIIQEQMRVIEKMNESTNGTYKKAPRRSKRQKSKKPY